MAYIGASPSNGVRRKHTYTATASQTTFSGAGAEGVSLSYRDSNYVDVYVNGVKLGDADYTATSGTSIVLGVGAAVNDIVEIITYDVFSVADTVSKADGGQFDGNVTMAGTLAVTGETTLSANLNLGDNDKAIFGAGDDLQIYHDGSNSYIDDVGTGNLNIRAENLTLEDTSGNNYLTGAHDGEVRLYYINSQKLAVNNTGIDVTGTLTADGMTMDTGDNSVYRLEFGANRGSDEQALGIIRGSWNGTVVSQINLSAGDDTTNKDNGQIFFRTASAGTTANRLRIEENGDISFYEDTGTTPKFFWDASVQALSVNESTIISGGTPQTTPSIQASDGGTAGAGFGVVSANDEIAGQLRIAASSQNAVYLEADPSNQRADSWIGFRVDGSNVARFDSSGNFGIGTSSPSSFNSNANNLVVGSGSGGEGMTIYSGTTDNGAIFFADGTSGASETMGGISYNHNDNSLNLRVNNDPKLYITSSGNVGIGTSSPASDAGLSKILQLGSSSDTSATFVLKDDDGDFEIGSAGGSLRIYDDGLERVRIDQSGNVGIGTSSPAATSSTYKNLQLALAGIVSGRTDDTPLYLSSNVSYNAGWKYIQNTTASQIALGTNIQFFNAPSGTAGAAATLTERMRIDSSGNLLVGKTSVNVGTIGHELRGGGGPAVFTRNSDTVVFINRESSDGELIQLRQDDATIGGIYSSPSITGPFIGHINVGLAMYHNGDSVLPSGTGGLRDNAIDLGNSSNRFDDVFATNSSIQTSDRNEKQDIEELSEAEQRVAVVAKGLMRKYRWRDAVAEKGENARTHFGIIAQDLQDAFTAEGLDANDYAMFCSDTWWEKEISVDAVEADEENGIEAKDAYTYRKIAEEATEGYTEKTRLGVRYSELLAFIISAI